MKEEIINRVKKSSLHIINLEDYYPEGKRATLDIKNWLFEDFVLKEQDFRQRAKTYNWEQYQDCYVALTCSTEAIIPAWAYMLLCTYLEPFTIKTVVGDLVVLETAIYQDIIRNLDCSVYHDKPIIIKGCTQKPIPPNAFIQLTTKLKPIAKSIMYGEACSAVPLFKKTNNLNIK